jgi:hypothetical protein
MTHRVGVGRRAPSVAAVATLLALLISLPPAVALGAGWTTLKRVTDVRGSRLDSLHQLSAERGTFHLVHPAIGPNDSDDRILYQRSDDGGAHWSDPATLFLATSSRPNVVPNLALASGGKVVAVAWRVQGPEGHSLYVRVSRDGGASFRRREALFSTKRGGGIGVPAVTVGLRGSLVAVAWTDRAKGTIKVRTSRDGGRSFRDAQVLGRTGLSIDCRKRMTDGLVGLAASERSVHVAWSRAPGGKCQASSIDVRSSLDRGATWSPARTITARRSYGWPELDARGGTVLATVQSPTGGVILGRSSDDGQTWSDRLLKAPKGSSFSAADVVLLPGNRARLTYVNERIRKAKLVSTKLVSRWSSDNGATLKQAKIVTPEARRLRMAPNIAGDGERVVIVVQSGPLSGMPRNLYVARQR